jgi:hypothetical protein
LLETGKCDDGFCALRQLRRISGKKSKRVNSEIKYFTNATTNLAVTNLRRINNRSELFLMNFKEKNVMNNDYQITSTTGIKIEGYHSTDLFLYFLNQLFSKYTGCLS